MKRILLFVSILVICNFGVFAQDGLATKQYTSTQKNNVENQSNPRTNDSSQEYHQAIVDVRSSIDTLTSKSDDYFKWEMKPNWEKHNFWISNIIAVFSILIMIFVYCKTREDMNNQIKEQHQDTNNQINNQQKNSSNQIDTIKNAAENRDVRLRELGEKIDKSVERITTVIAGKNDYEFLSSSINDIKKWGASLLDLIVNDFTYFSGNRTNYEKYSNTVNDIISLLEKNQRILLGYNIDFSEMTDRYKESLDTLLKGTDEYEQLDQIDRCNEQHQSYCNEIESVIEQIKNESNK